MLKRSIVFYVPLGPIYSYLVAATYILLAGRYKLVTKINIGFFSEKTLTAKVTTPLRVTDCQKSVGAGDDFMPIYRV